MAKCCFEFDEAKYVKHLQDDVSRISEAGGVIDFGGGMKVFLGPVPGEKLQKFKKELSAIFGKGGDPGARPV
jgi:hypothetical protein